MACSPYSFLHTVCIFGANFFSGRGETRGEGPILSRSLQRKAELRVLGDAESGLGSRRGQVPRRGFLWTGARTLGKSASCVPVERRSCRRGAAGDLPRARRLPPGCLLRPQARPGPLSPRPESCAEGGDGWTGRDRGSRSCP